MSPSSDDWKVSFGAKPNEKMPAELIDVAVSRDKFQLYVHEARYLRDCITAALVKAGHE